MENTRRLEIHQAVNIPDSDRHYRQAKRFIFLFSFVIGGAALLRAFGDIFGEWGWNALAGAFTFAAWSFGLVCGCYVGLLGWRAFSFEECRTREYALDAKSARTVNEASTHTFVLGDKNKVNVNSPQMTDGRTVILKVQPHQRVVDYKAPELKPPEVMPPDYLDWLLAEMLSKDTLARADVLKWKDPSGNEVGRAVWEAVIDALYDADCITGDRTAKRKDWKVTDFRDILRRLAARHPDGIVLRENGFPMLASG